MIVVSSKWMSQVHSLVPLTEQEEEVSHILLQHAVFSMSNRMHVVDFPSRAKDRDGCWRSTSRKGLALTWVERNGCYVDVKFRRIKGEYPDLKCVALVQVMQANLALVREYVSAVMEHGDVLCCSMEELAGVVREWCGKEGGLR